MADKYKAKLTRSQYWAAYEGVTEPCFDNAYFENTRDGLYKSVASGTIVFSSKDKYDAGNGWPTFRWPAILMPQ